MSTPILSMGSVARFMGVATVVFLLAGCEDKTLSGNGSGDDDGGNGDDDDDGGSGDADADGDGDDDDQTGPTCGENDFNIERAPVDMLILLDRSRSMQVDNLWEPMKTAIQQVTSTIKTIDFGLLMFPDASAPETVTNPADAYKFCTQSTTQPPDVAVGPNTSGAIVTAMNGAIPKGSTPTAAALAAALTYMKGLSDANSKYVLLATDGAPNCNFSAQPGCPNSACTAATTQECDQVSLYCLDDQTTYAAAKALKDSGFPVYVMGIGAKVNAQWASVMTGIAQNGGTNDYYSAENTDDIKTQFQTILGKAVSCEFDVDLESLDEQADPQQVNLFCKASSDEENSSKNVIGWDKDCKKGTGWDWVDNTKIKFCGDLCKQFKAGSCATVSATFGCESIVE